MKNNFIDKGLLKHGDKFDYSYVEYVNAKVKVEIRCTTHNLHFFQTPDKHLQSTHGCPMCLKEFKKPYKRVKKKDFKDFNYYLKRLEHRYGKTFEIIGEYKGLQSIVRTTCAVHYTPTDTIRNLLLSNRKYSCKECASDSRILNKTFSVERSLTELSEKHPNLIFDLTNYTNRKSKVKCFCEKHGSFEKSVEKLIHRGGCFGCTIERLIEEGKLIGGYSEKLFRENPDLKNIDGYFYILKIDDLYKIGITRISVKDRIKNLRSASGCKDIHKVFSARMNLYRAYKLEQKTLRKYKKYRQYLKWSTEILKFNSGAAEQFLNNYILENIK